MPPSATPPLPPPTPGERLACLLIDLLFIVGVALYWWLILPKVMR